MWREGSSKTVRAKHSQGTRGERGRADSDAWGKSENMGLGTRLPLQPPDSDRKGVPGLEAGGSLASFVPSTPGRRQPPGKTSVPKTESGPLVPQMAELTAPVELGEQCGEGAGWGVSLALSPNKSQLKPSSPSDSTPTIHLSCPSQDRWALLALPAP